MEPATISVVIGIVTVAVNILVLSIGGTWKIGELKASLVKAINDSQDSVEAKQNKHEHDVGEALAALREKIREVELFMRDNYMRRDSFQEINRQNVEALNNIVEKIDKRLERMEAKIDAKP